MVRPITILVCALGGEGGGVLAEWLYHAAVRAGHAAQASSIPGVAQRTGATTYYIEVSAAPLAAGAAPPVFSLSPVPGGIDLLVSSELLETLRQVGNGLVSRERTTVFSSTARALTVAEKAQLGDGRRESAALVQALQQHARAAELLDFGALAREAGTVVSAVMFGAIAASGVLPWPRALFEDTIAAGSKAGSASVQASLRGFGRAFDALSQRQAQQALVTQALAAPDLPNLARARLREYQDETYVRLFDERLARVQAAEVQVDPTGGQGGRITAEMVRWLALWMAFDDIVRVAQLKLASSRQARVRREVGAAPGDVVKVFDHFKPGVAEFAALLPSSIADRLQAWDRRRIAAGREPWALPIKLATHSLRGALMLRLLAAMRGQRRRGQRFVQEQALIERWLATVEAGTREHWTLGHELALCGRLIKGYGSTNERGKERLLHIVDHLFRSERSAAERAAAIRAVREAALRDEGQFDTALREQGAPPTPIREQQVRWYKRRPRAFSPYGEGSR